jgi:MFS family permease
MHLKTLDNISKMYLIHFLLSLQFFSAVIIPFFIDWGKLNFTQTLFIQSWFSVWILLLEVPTGAIADYFGRKTSIALGCLVNILAALIYGTFPIFFAFLVAEFFWAVAFTLFSGACEALLYDSLKEAKKGKFAKKFFGRYQSAHLLGFVLAGPVGSILAKVIGLNIPMLIYVIPLSIAFIFTLSLKEPKRKVEERERILKIIKEGLRFVVKNKDIRALSIDFALLNLISYFILWFYQPMLKKAGIDIALWGFIVVAMNVSGFLLNLKLEKISGFLGEKKFLIFDNIAMLSIFVYSCLFANPLVLVSILLFASSFRVIRRPFMQALMNKHIPSKQRATVLSAASMLGRLLIALVNPLIGYLADLSLEGTYFLLALLGLIFTFLSTLRLKI